MNGWTFACPQCQTPLQTTGEGSMYCPTDALYYPLEDGIWRLLAPGRAEALARFIHEYETVRWAEGRGVVEADPVQDAAERQAAYFRALPFEDLSGRFRKDWQIRAVSYRTLRQWVVDPIARGGRTLRVLDLGAGNGWLAHRLARDGHRVLAVDLMVNRFDGLGAHVYYEVDFTPVQAEFDRLPLAQGEADLAIFNASLHYATQIEQTLREALRVLRRGGVLAVMDTPVYRHAESGRRMVEERQAHFLKQVGFASDALPSENFLTFDRIEQLAVALSVRWQQVEPFYGIEWAVRPWRARLRGRREPARFVLFWAQKP